MDNVKDDQYYVAKILDDLKAVILYTKGRTKAEFETDEVLIDAIMFRIIQIAENSTRLSETFKAVNNKVPWKAIRGMRNIIVHDYGEMDLTIVYDTVIHGIPYMYDLFMGIAHE